MTGVNCTLLKQQILLNQKVFYVLLNNKWKSFDLWKIWQKLGEVKYKKPVAVMVLMLVLMFAVFSIVHE